MVERVNKELKRRTRVAGVFPNEESLLLLVGSILMDVNEDWVTGRRYLTLEEERSDKETGLRQITEDLKHYLINRSRGVGTWRTHTKNW